MAQQPLLDHRLCGTQAIFMKAVAHPGARKPSAVVSLHRWHVLLGLNGPKVKHRMLVMDFLQHVLRVQGAQRIERDKDGVAKGQGLQSVEPVMQANMA